MSESTIASGADDVLDFNDIVLITMSSSANTGRVMAASICSCGNVVAPAAHSAASATPDIGYAVASRSTTLGERICRRFIDAVRSLRAS